MSAKQAILAGLFAGVVFALVTGLFVGADTFFSAAQGGNPTLLIAKATGPLVAGLLFGAGIALVLARAGKQLSIPEGETPEWFQADEVLLRQGPANHWRRAMNYGGWLYLTNTRLRFVPHRMLQAQDPQEWPLEEITGTDLAQSLLVVPNGLQVLLQDGSEQRFVVRLSERDDLRNAIDDARAALQIGPPPEPGESGPPGL